MSYILDALRRAEAERERGAVPSLHSQQFAVRDADDEAPRRPIGWMIAAALLALALLGVVLWLWLAPRPQPVVVVAAPVAVTPMTPAATAPPAASVPAALPAAVAPAPAPPVPSVPSVPSVPMASAPPPTATRSMPARAAPPPRDSATASTREPVRRPDRADRSTTAAGPAETSRVYALAELPDAPRRAVPALAFGGSSWSSDAGSRMVIWNGRVFHEGDALAPGVTLTRIERKSALLTVQGYRVQINF